MEYFLDFPSAEATVQHAFEGADDGDAEEERHESAKFGDKLEAGLRIVEDVLVLERAGEKFQLQKS